MMSPHVKRQAAAIFRRALAAYGATCAPVYRTDHDANGVPIGPARKVGCVYGVKYERGQTANVLVDVPGVIARMDATRLCCTLSGCAGDLQEGDAVLVSGVWYSVLSANVLAEIMTDVVLKEGSIPDGLSI